MTTVVFVNHRGERTEVAASPGSSIMQAAVDNGVEGIVAECGGCCSCATCHCYVDEAWLPQLPPASALERSMLECVPEPRPNSRLSCQIFLYSRLDGILIRLPPSQGA